MNNVFYTGVVEDRTNDPLKLGRCKVRVFGLHTENKAELPTKDLPWATVLQPITSAAMSGIGHSPVGPVEGSWVMVAFADIDQQYPIIIGTMGGVPSKNQVKTYTEVNTSWTTSDGTPLTDSSGQPVQSGSTQQVSVTPAETSTIKKPFSFSLSEYGLKELKKEEGLASLDRDRRRVGNDSTPASTSIYSYKDTRGIWTIGWGSIFMPDGSKVTSDSVITKAEADKLLFDRLDKEFVAGVRKGIKVPLTQSMFDSCVSMAYNMGVSGFLKSQVGVNLNSGKYKEAAALIPLTKNNEGTLARRREAEKALFVKDGFPTTDGEIEPSPKTEEQKQQEVDRTENPVIIRQPSSVNVAATQTLNQVKADGFMDPSEFYPKWTNEPDTHRLARHESVDNTIVFSKEAARAKGVRSAGGVIWSQPPIPYNAQYPFNHVFATESGHIEEWDDTKGNERTHSFHRSGTFREVDVNGTEVRRIVGDSFEILERHGHVLIRGNCNVTIEGTSNVRIENDSNIDVLGNLNLRVAGNVKQAVGGNFQLHAGGEVHIDASKIYLNSGKASGVGLPSEGASGTPAFGSLQVPSRSSDVNSNYETPEEGDKEEFNQQAVNSGRIDPEEATPTEAKDVKKESNVAQRQAEAVPTECGQDIQETTVFNKQFRLSENFTLGNVCTGKSGIPSGVNYGLSAQEIVCNLRLLAVNVLEPTKKRFPNLIVTSSWRSQSHNESIGGSKTSEHLFGMAVDIVLNGFDREQHYDAIQMIQKDLKAFGQLILEYKGSNTWIHVSFNKKNNRMQCLTIDAARNKTLKSGGFMLV
jgi:GH24 family phage-related lysozyme (muramidase)